MDTELHELGKVLLEARIREQRAAGVLDDFGAASAGIDGQANRPAAVSTAGDSGSSDATGPSSARYDGGRVTYRESEDLSREQRNPELDRESEDLSREQRNPELYRESEDLSREQRNPKPDRESEDLSREQRNPKPDRENEGLSREQRNSPPACQRSSVSQAL
jgi:hypothetical protein